MTITIIGDVHGKTQQYQKMLRQVYSGQRTVQVGDMGIGFKGVGLHEMPQNHKWFRGNHDNPTKCRENKNYLGDYGYLPEDELFWLAGAYSIDRDWRIAGISWWEDEELSYQELTKAIDLYKQVKPKYMLSHEAPTRAGRILLIDLIGEYHVAKGDCCNSRTALALEAMFESHKPKEWVFGHFHLDKSFELEGTKFTCVNELSTYDLNL